MADWFSSTYMQENENFFFDLVEFFQLGLVKNSLTHNFTEGLINET